MAATALVHRWTLVTRNVGDFASAGVRLLNPFAGKSHATEQCAFE
jgi:predicted nucleic acid-binding protein